MTHDPDDKRILFCWSAGGMSGLDIHAGIWGALQQHGIVSTANAGASAGAIVAAMNSAGMKADLANAIVRDLQDSDVRRSPFLWKLRVPWLNAWLSHDPIKELLAKYIPEQFEDLVKPCGIYATHDLNGYSAKLNLMPLRTAVLASMSIAGVFPPVALPSGALYSDGGTTNYLAVRQDDLDSFDEIWLLIASPPVTYTNARTGILSRLKLNIDWLLENQINNTINCLRTHIHSAIDDGRHFAPVVVIRPELDIPKGSLHFDHSLIDQAWQQASAQIAAHKETHHERSNGNTGTP
jgi:hypothetical protein